MSQLTEPLPSLEEILAKLLDESELDSVLGCAVDGHSKDGNPPRLSLLHLRFNEDTPNLDNLVSYLCSQAMNYALNRKRRDGFIAELQNAKNGNLSVIQRINKAVRDAFIEFREAFPNRASEVGEVLAFCIATHYLQASQLIAKMSLKTSPNMPVHGLDGVHAAVKGDTLTVYFLESKLTSTAAKGLKDFAESIKGFDGKPKQYAREYELVCNLGNLDTLPENEREHLLGYLDVYSKASVLKRERSVGVVCYSEEKHYSNVLPIDDGDVQKHENHFAGLFAADHEVHQKYLLGQLKKHELLPGKCSVYLVAVPSVATLRKSFYSELGIPPIEDEQDDTNAKEA
ncbi:DUF1837 domain-containing protein [Pseudomonas sp. NY15181]|uniref:HamA C-terminal domain-containing protein n=1 Tax=Pseudomonas sp. NY15181 TaxID=3400349 RepID=UPI003A8BAA79